MICGPSSKKSTKRKCGGFPHESRRGLGPAPRIRFRPGFTLWPGTLAMFAFPARRLFVEQKIVFGTFALYIRTCAPTLRESHLLRATVRRLRTPRGRRRARVAADATGLAQGAVSMFSVRPSGRLYVTINDRRTVAILSNDQDTRSWVARSRKRPALYPEYKQLSRFDFGVFTIGRSVNSLTRAFNLGHPVEKEGGPVSRKELDSRCFPGCEGCSTDKYEFRSYPQM
jgi:hypothetical protein